MSLLDSNSGAPSNAVEARTYVASQWQLMWWKFCDHRLAVASLGLVALLYLMALFCEFLAPMNPYRRDASHSFAPPQRVRVFDESWRPHWPFVYPLVRRIDEETLARTYREDRARTVPIQFLAKGDPYRLWGLIPMERHLFGAEGERIYLLGADRLGRDMLSRALYGSRVSLSIGLIGVALSLVLGVVIGGISGYYGGAIDNMIQRFIEILRSFPTIPLWLALSAAMPATWSQLTVYFAMTVILAFIGWTDLARVVRGKILSLREEDYATAARVAGVPEFQIIMRHLIPGFTSHLIVAVTLSIPAMVMAETSLSFLGLGLRPPTISWGVLLQEAQNIRAVVQYPWLLMPAGFVFVSVLMFNFLGDGLRDAADPYSH